MNPRNREQIKNAQKQIKAKQCISRDDIYNLYVLALELDDFIWQIDIFPNLDCIVGLKDIMILFNDLLTLQSEEFQIILAYDMTFQLGDFYVSPLLFRHTYFEGTPIIPLAFLIHDRKFQLSHEKLFSKLTEKIPNLKKKKVLLIIDQEKGVNNATKLVPSLCPLLCWNHIWQDIKQWVRSHNGTSDDIHVYLDHIMKLLKSENEAEFEENYKILSMKWSKEFLEYFQVNKGDLMKFAARYNIEPWNIYNPNSGVTNNVAESLNTVIKRFLDWNQLPVDSLCLSLYYLQTLYFAEIQRGMIGVGQYKLRKEFQALQQAPEDLRIPKSYAPEEIVDTVKMQLQDPLKVNQSNLDTENSLLPNNSTFNKNLPSSPMNINEGDDLSSHPMPILNSTASLIGKDINVSITSHVTQQNQSQIALACDAVENKRVELVPNMSAFIVQSNNQKTYSVQLFPKEKCNSPSTTTC